MRKIKEVLGLKLDAQMSHQQIAAALGISKGVVTKYVGLTAAAGLHWPQVRDTDETALERRLLVAPERPRDHVQPDYGCLHQELRRKGMMLLLLWEEPRADHARNRIGVHSVSMWAGAKDGNPLSPPRIQIFLSEEALDNREKAALAPANAAFFFFIVRICPVVFACIFYF